MLISSQNLITILLHSCFCFACCIAIDTITTTQFIKDPESIISNGSIFELGFFSLDGSGNRYVGIFYHQFSVLNIVWVANRDKPLNDFSGVVVISEEGNLLVLNGQNVTLWSSNVSYTSTNTSAQLLDSGNLVLQELNSNNGDYSGRIVWESFKHPGNSLLQNMKLSTNVRTGEKLQLTSWTTSSDASNGSFSAGLHPLNIPEIFIWNGNHPYWRSGPWNGQIFIGIPTMNSVYLNGFALVDDKEGSYYVSFDYADKSLLLNLVLYSQGTLEQIHWDNGTNNWETDWFAPEFECDFYNKCGAFGSCKSLGSNSPICSCLRGFEPMNKKEWNRGDRTSGCVRRTALQCGGVNSSGSEKGKQDGFLKLNMMKVPAFAERLFKAGAEGDCRSECLKNCSCSAYAYYTGIGCMIWRGDLIDIQQFSFGGANLNIRVAYSELADKSKGSKVVIIVTVIIGTITIAICAYFSWIRITKRRAKMKAHQAYPKFSDDHRIEDDMNQAKLQELPAFNFVKLATATNNFHIDNKLGQGGFGPVYKGKLLDGREIAVKRLSRASGQGLEEFTNEVVVISKLQHRNLVRLLGFCIEGEEKMLIYEYMPNKSLDAFLFDPLKQELLHWRKRFDIIEGIGRGLLYLHRDSRLRIIHRDLKASNILLDEVLNPKISDFGMARIFGNNQDQADTRRVVGTYGYMSPEYAMEGRFSEKSDVFSFGVLLLEIVSGRKNSSFYHDENSLSLLGFVWKLWNEENNIAIIDPVILDPCFQVEICRCINVGLLCVQEFAKDRPTVSTVLSMLSSEIADLPKPKQPAFIERLNALDTESSQQNRKRPSINNVTITIINDGR